MSFKNDFRPDVIAGNVPYNNGMDIDFLFDAFEVARIAIVEITPAKFQTSDANQRIDSEHSYGEFRKEISKYIKYLVFYPDAAEIFEIRNTDGIAFYVINKRHHGECKVINRNLHQKALNSCAIRDISNRQTLHNIGQEILDSLGTYEAWKFKNITGTCRYQVWTGNQINGGCGWGYSDRKNPCSTLNIDGALKCIGSSLIVDTCTDIKDTRGASTCIFESDNIDECKSFISWLDTKLVRFLVFINIGKLTGIFTDDYFRFVPKPYKGFTSLYTDIEMYDYYNLNKNYIDAIESIILDR